MCYDMCWQEAIFALHYNHPSQPVQRQCKDKDKDVLARGRLYYTLFFLHNQCDVQRQCTGYQQQKLSRKNKTQYGYKDLTHAKTNTPAE